MAERKPDIPRTSREFILPEAEPALSPKWGEEGSHEEFAQLPDIQSGMRSCSEQGGRKQTESYGQVRLAEWAPDSPHIPLESVNPTDRS